MRNGHWAILLSAVVLIHHFPFISLTLQLLKPVPIFFILPVIFHFCHDLFSPSFQTLFFSIFLCLLASPPKSTPPSVSIKEYGSWPHYFFGEKAVIMLSIFSANNSQLSIPLLDSFLTRLGQKHLLRARCRKQKDR